MHVETCSRLQHAKGIGAELRILRMNACLLPPMLATLWHLLGVILENLIYNIREVDFSELAGFTSGDPRVSWL
jgi:hypothetical protein